MHKRIPSYMRGTIPASMLGKQDNF